MLFPYQAIRSGLVSPETMANAASCIVRISNATGFFVGTDGMIITNHHVLWEWSSKQSSISRGQLEDGFAAHSREEEWRIPQMFVDIYVHSSIAHDQADTWSRKHYELMSERLEDVRLVYAPSLREVYGGGNQHRPAHCVFDCIIVRAYKNGLPYRPSSMIRLRRTPVVTGDPLYTLGFPAFTKRRVHPFDLAQTLDYRTPIRRQILERRRNFLVSGQRFDAEFGRVSDELNVLNSSQWVVSLKADEDAFGLELEQHLQIERDFLLEEQCVTTHGSRVLRMLQTMLALESGQDPSLFQSLASGRSRSEIDSWLESVGSLDALKERADLEFAFATFRQLLPASHPINVALSAVPETHAFFDGARALIMNQFGGAMAQDRVRSIREFGEQLSAWGFDILSRLEKIRSNILRINQQWCDSADRADSIVSDADGSLRVATGSVQGWTRGSKALPALLTGRHLQVLTSQSKSLPIGNVPYDQFIDRVFHFFFDADVAGGASGSPVFDLEGKICGVVFGGNAESLAGRWQRHPNARGAALSIATMLEVIASAQPNAVFVRELDALMN